MFGGIIGITGMVFGSGPGVQFGVVRDQAGAVIAGAALWATYIAIEVWLNFARFCLAEPGF